MGEASKIQWTNDTFNPWIGCAKVSAGCTNCYAEVNTFARRSRANGLELWGPKAERHVTSDENWKKPLRWNREAAASGQPRRVFCASLCDVFEDREDLVEPRARLLKLIEATPALTWMLLTKRPENMVRLAARWPKEWPRNVWALTTVENQAAAEERIPHLLRVPAAVRGISAEPLLGPLDLRPWLTSAPTLTAHGPRRGKRRIHWVIVGGESGPHARPFEIEHARQIIRQCREVGTAPFFKQAGTEPVVANDSELDEDWPQGSVPIDDDYEPQHQGELAPLVLRDPKGGDLDELPADLRVREWPTP